MNDILTIFTDLFLLIVFISLGMPLFICLYFIERKIKKLGTWDLPKYNKENLKALICWIVSALSVVSSYVIMRFGFDLHFTKDLQVFFIMLASYIYGFFIPYTLFRCLYLRVLTHAVKKNKNYAK